MSKVVEKTISDLIADPVDAAGYDVVRVQITGGGKFAALQVMAERKDGLGMTVDDCGCVSEKVSSLIEAVPEFAGRFDLEVSSPGIDRPLVKLRDYERFQGYVAKIELNGSVEGPRRFQGKIEGVSKNEIKFSADRGTITVPFDAIERAKLVLTDDLLKAALGGKTK